MKLSVPASALWPVAASRYRGGPAPDCWIIGDGTLAGIRAATVGWAMPDSFTVSEYRKCWRKINGTGGGGVWP